MTNDSDRSWLNIIRIGSTMTTEAWDMKYKSNLGWNHAWGASPSYIIANKLMGIEPMEPAFRKIQIKPRPGKLKWAKIKMPTIRGSVHARFENHPDKFLLDLQIPANTIAKVALQNKRYKKFTITLNGKKVDAIEEGDFLVINPVKSGKTIIKYTKNKKQK